MKAACLKKESLTVRLGELLYYVFFAGLLFAKGIGLYDGQRSFKIILIVSCVCWAGKMLMTEFEWKELLTAVLLLLLGGVVYRVSGDKGFLLYVMMVTGAKDVPLKRVFAVGILTWLLSFGGMFFLTASHLVSSPFKIHEKGGELIVRWGLGSPHPNVLHVSYLVFCMFAGFCLDKRINLKWLLAMMAGNFYVFLYSVSFTGFIAVSFYLALCGYWMLRKKIEAVDKTLLYGGAAFCVLFSMAGPVLIRGKAFEVINHLLNTRFLLSRTFLTNCPYSLFGTKLSDIVTYSATMDCSYVYAYVAYGTPAFLLLMAGYAFIIRKYAGERKGKELCMILASMVAGVTEPFLFNTSFKNISLLFFRDLIYPEKNTARSGRVVSFGHVYDRAFEIPTERFTGVWSRISGIIRNGKGKLFILFALAFVIGAALHAGTADRPQRIVVPRDQSDLDESWYTELNLTPDQITDGDVVYGRIEEDAVLMGLRGRAIDLEMLRDAVNFGTLAGGLTLIITIVYSYFRGRDNV